jgi:transcriptional regulator with XRE-family HTH domain
MLTAEEIVQRVSELWNKEGGWIPGASYKKLAEALGVDPDSLTHYEKGRGRVHAPGYGKADDQNIGIG